MSLEFTTYTVPLFVTSAITFVLILMAAQRQHNPVTRMFILYCTAVVIWSIGYSFEFMVPGEPAKLFWARVQYIGLTSPVAFLLFTQLYLGIEERIEWQTFITLMIMPLIANVAAWTNDQHRMLWTDWWIDSESSPGLVIKHGPIFYAIVAYSYLLLLCGVYYIWQGFRSSNAVRVRQAGILLAAVAPPWLGNLLYVLHLTPKGLDLTPINFGISSIFLGLGLLRYHLLDVKPIARNRIIEKLADPVIVIDGQGRIVDVNPASINLLGKNQDELLAQSAADVLSALPGLAQLLEADTSVDLRTELAQGSSQRIFNTSASLIRDGSEQIQGRVLVLHDVTEREHDADALRQSESQLRAMVQQLQELDQLKNRFLRNINHELRTPLTNITLYADLLKRGNPENHSRYISVIEKEAATLRRLIEQTLALSQVDQMVEALPLQRKMVDLNQMIGLLVRNSTEIATKSRVAFSYNLPNTPVIIQADTEKLNVALSNMLTNAFNYTPKGGAVSLALERNGKYAKIQIKDSGLGISTSDQQHIFDRFFRGEAVANGSIPGLGLGLSSAKSSIELHGGHIQVESTPGQGSTFTVFLPLCDVVETA
ncbi:MAG: histidine kinase N-terminal 7TM domain-containing protein [Caldilineaceae bacterium]